MNHIVRFINGVNIIYLIRFLVQDLVKEFMLENMHIYF